MRAALALTVALAAAAPLSAQPAPAPEAPDFAHEVLAAMDRDADPCQDFYQYACGSWLATTELPPDQPIRLRSFSTIRDRNQEVVRDLLEEAATSRGDHARGLIGRFYGACMDEAAVERAGVKPLRPLLKAIDRVDDPASLLAVTGELHRSGFQALFGIGVVPDFKDPDLNIAIMAQGGLGLPERDYYLSEDEGKKALRQAYQAHVARLLGLLGAEPSAAAADAARVVAFETRLAQSSREATAMRQMETLYNRMEVAGLKRLTPGLPWDSYLAAIGRPGLSHLSVATPEFFTALEGTVRETDPAVLRAYLRFHLANGAAALLDEELVEASFDFYGRTLSGQQEMEPRWKRCVDATEGGLGEAVGKLYVEQMFAGSSKAVAQEMIEDIEAAFAASLPDITWMDDETRARAHAKLDAVTNKIGFPDRWEGYEGLRLSRSRYFDNTVAVARLEHDRELAKVGRPVDRSEWGMSPQEVNAYYNPLGNEMAFPAGILQPPFFHRSFPAAYNYGGIGGAIGHELTHGFDDQGRKFDATGRLEEWWAPEVAGRFEERAQCIVDQYSSYEVEPGLRVNGELTLGENIADIGGLKQAHRAYTLWEARHGAPEPAVPGLTNEQLLFVAWGQAWCAVASPEMERLRVSVDPHSPPRFRVNGPMAAVPAFAEAFQCAPGTPLNPAERCAVW